jgi:hypothetical protein
MSQGELFGLHWPEVDLEKGAVRVVRSLAQQLLLGEIAPPLPHGSAGAGGAS